MQVLSQQGGCTSFTSVISLSHRHTRVYNSDIIVSHISALYIRDIVLHTRSMYIRDIIVSHTRAFYIRDITVSRTFCASYIRDIFVSHIRALIIRDNCHFLKFTCFVNIGDVTFSTYPRVCRQRGMVGC